MHDDDTLSGTVLDETGLSLDQLALACRVEPAWLIARFEAGLLNTAEHGSGGWHVAAGGVTRARRMWQCERTFDAAPELAALVADLLEELDAARAQLAQSRRR